MMAKKKRSYKKRKPVAKKTGSRLFRAIWWLITFINGVVLSASIYSVFYNQGDVQKWIVWSAVVSGVVAVALITYRVYTTNEDLAFNKR